MEAAGQSDCTPLSQQGIASHSLYKLMSVAQHASITAFLESCSCLQGLPPPLPVVHSRLGALPLGSLLPTGPSPGRVPQMPSPGPGPRTRVTVLGLAPRQAPPPLLRTPAQPIKPTAGRVIRVSPAVLLRTSLRLRLGQQLLLQHPAPLVVGPHSPSGGPRALLRTPLLLKLPCHLEAFRHLAHLLPLVNPVALPRSSLRPRLGQQLLLQLPAPLVVGPPSDLVRPRALLRTPLLLQPQDPLVMCHPSVSVGPRALLRIPLPLQLPCQLHPQASQLKALQHLAHLAGLLPQPWQGLQPHLRSPPLLPHPRSPSSGQTPLPKVPPPAVVSPRTRLLLLLSLEPLGALLHP